MENTLNALQFTIYPSLEALSCFGFISEGVDDMKYSVDTHVSYYHWFGWFRNTKEYSSLGLLRVSK